MFNYRSFPGMYHGSKAKLKRKAPEPARLLELQFCLLSEHAAKTPKDETLLLQAGLGRRTVNLSEDADHTEVSQCAKTDA